MSDCRMLILARYHAGRALHDQGAPVQAGGIGVETGRAVEGARGIAAGRIGGPQQPILIGHWIKCIL